MQYIHDKGGLDRKPLGLGWRGIVFGIVTVVLSLMLSIRVADLVASIIL